MKKIIMKIEKDDIIFGITILILLSIWYITLILFKYPLLSIIFLWTAMSVLSLLYIYVYRKRKRNKKIMRIRFFVTAIPLYPVLIYYVYKLAIEKNLPTGHVYLPFFVVFSILILNAILIYFYEIRKTNKIFR
jgi:hypothetical protein